MAPDKLWHMQYAAGDPRRLNLPDIGYGLRNAGRHPAGGCLNNC